VTASRPRTVTALRERRRGLVAVELDGEPWRVVPADAVVRAGLAVGRPLDRERARRLAQALRRAHAVARATRALGPRDRTRRDLEQRLTRAGVPPAAREEALTSLEEAGLVDDARVARSRAETLARRGFGDAAIRSDLARQGVAGDAAREAVAGLEPEQERARRLVASTGADARALRRLAARGFDPETVRELASFADTE
jgi:SOS response regulatory protein OraA/RecX